MVEQSSYTRPVLGSIPSSRTKPEIPALRQVFCFCASRSVVLHLQNREPGPRASLLTSKLDLWAHIKTCDRSLPRDHRVCITLLAVLGREVDSWGNRAIRPFFYLNLKKYARLTSTFTSQNNFVESRSNTHHVLGCLFIHWFFWKSNNHHAYCRKHIGSRVLSPRTYVGQDPLGPPHALIYSK